MSHFQKVRPTKNYRKSNYSCSKIYNSCSDKDLLILSSLCPFHKIPVTMGTHLFVLEICRCSPIFLAKHGKTNIIKSSTRNASNTFNTCSPPPCWATRQSFHDEPEPQPKKKQQVLTLLGKIISHADKDL